MKINRNKERINVEFTRLSDLFSAPHTFLQYGKLTYRVNKIHFCQNTKAKEKKYYILIIKKTG